MKVLLVSPFSPLEPHDHAAADTIVRLACELGKRTELFVYSPTHTASTAATGSRSFTALPASDETLKELGGSWSSYLGLKPVWLRKTWPKAANRDVARYLHQIHPDVIHVEYLQAAEVALQFHPSVVTLHDVTECVMWRALKESCGLRRAHMLLEYIRTRNFERRVLGSKASVVALSRTDRDVFTARTTKPVEVVKIGLDAPKASWSVHSGRDAPLLLFVGAMWRSANIAIAVYLAEHVMPLLWKDQPAARLRIVGSRPSRRVCHLAEVDRRVNVTGFVDDLDDEFANADVVLAPTVLGGGVLLKLLRAMAVGCPVITSSESARAIEADSRALWVADDAASMAASIIAILGSKDRGASRARRGRMLTERMFNWAQAVDSYCGLYSEVIAQ